MKVKVDSVSAVEKKLMISVAGETVATEINKEFERVNAKAKIPGFRPGKIPRPLLEKYFESSVKAQVYEDIVKKSIANAIEEQKIEVITIKEISQPTWEHGQDFSYVASVEVKPEFEPKDYMGIKIKSNKPEVTLEKVNAALEQIRQAQAVLQDRKDATQAQKGDVVSVLIVPAKSKTKGKESLYEIGGQMLLPEMEEAISKLTLGHTTTVTVKDKNKNQDLVFEVTLKAIKEKLLPTVDDEFAKTVGDFTTLQALKEEIEKQLHEKAQKEITSENETKILSELLNKNKIEAPKSLIENQCDILIQQVQHYLSKDELNKLPDEPKKELRNKVYADAKRRVCEILILEAIAKKESITVRQEEVDGYIQILATNTKTPFGELKNYYEKTGRVHDVYAQILFQKALAFLLEKATINY